MMLVAVNSYILWITEALGYAFLNPQLRTGEAFFVHLDKTYPKWANEVKGMVGLDPFTNDENMPPFLGWLAGRFMGN